MKVELIGWNDVSMDEKFTKPFEKELTEKLGIGEMTAREISKIGEKLCSKFIKELYAVTVRND